MSHILLGSEYIAFLRTVPLSEDIPNGVTARAAYERVWIFFLDDFGGPNATGSWRLVDKQFKFNNMQLCAGTILSFDSFKFVKAVDSYVTVKFEITTLRHARVGHTCQQCSGAQGGAGISAPPPLKGLRRCS